MKVRHKTPTLVSMWMLDVFCCALGCVTLLWLLNTRQAGDQAVAARSHLEQLSLTRKDLSDTLNRLARLNAETELLGGRLRAAVDTQAELTNRLGLAQRDAESLQNRLADANRDLAAARASADAYAKELASAEARAKAAETALLQKKQEIMDLTRQALNATAAVDDLSRQLRDAAAERAALEAKYQGVQRDLAGLESKLAGAEAKLKAADEKQAVTGAAAKTAADKAKTELDAAKADAVKAGQELAVARKRIADLEGQLAGAGTDKATIIDLQGKNQKLADQVDILKRQAENRFAGIAMTGRNVVFMVDISGSMNKTDENTPNAAKWPDVCDTVGKVMRSIPTLSRYQVVVFSTSARWLLPPLGDWLTYDPAKSPDEVKAELLKLVPDGGTNLHAGFDMVFSLRSKGLDTIYLFSDGLPTQGLGLTPLQENANPPLPEAKRSEILSDYLLGELRGRWNKSAGGERVRINSIGFFYQSPNVGAFLWNLSRENDGSFVGMSRP